MKVTVLAGPALILTPRSALACATCISSPFGDQAYSWPYLGLILLPFGLIAAVTGILGYHSLRARLGLRVLAGYFGAKNDPQIIKETT